MDVKLGTKVKDSITGFVGFATARCEYINGCVQFEITPEELKDGIPQKEYWLDEQRVESIEEEVTKKPPRNRKCLSDYTSFGTGKKGGPQNNPTKSNPPSLAGYD